MSRSFVSAFLLSVVVYGCTPEVNLGSSDSGAPTGGGSTSGGGSGGGPGAMDDGGSDAGETDGGSLDAGLTDAGMSDAGPIDAGLTDAGLTDAGSIDAGSIDAGLAELQLADGGWSVPREGLFGGAVPVLTRAPSAPDVVYATNLKGDVFVSRDSGGAWARKTSLPRMIEELDVNLTRPDEVWARLAYAPGGTVKDIYRSSDGASTWTLVPMPLTSPNRLSAAGSVVWLAGYSGVGVALHRSVNGGQTFTAPTLPAGANANLRVIPHPTDPNLAWAFNWLDRLVWRTGDGGQSWAVIGPVITSTEQIGQLASSPSDPLRLWLSVFNARPWRSDDGGQSWQRLTNAPSATEYLPTNVRSEVWCSSPYFGTFRTTDDGLSWDAAPLPAVLTSQGQSLRVSPRSGLEALAYGVTPEIARTTDGVQWNRSVEGLSAVMAASVAISTSGNVLLVGSQHGQVFRSTDQGRHWITGGLGLLPMGVTALAFDPNDETIVYAGLGRGGYGYLTGPTTGSRMFKSLDGGLTFSTLTPASPYVADVTALFMHGSTIVASIAGAATSVSINGGQSWQFTSQMSLSTILDDVRVMPSTTVLEYVGRRWNGSRMNLEVSTSQGASWSSVPESQPEVVGLSRIARAAGSRTSALVYYASTGRELDQNSHFGRYNGSSWDLGEVGLGPPGGPVPEFNALGVTTANGLDVLLGTTEKSLHLSRNSAMSWSNLALPVQPSGAIALSSDGQLGLVGLFGDGVLVTRTGGR